MSGSPPLPCDDLAGPNQSLISIASLRLTAGGLWNSSNVQPDDVSRFVWFLPLQREHVKQCAQSTMEQRKKHLITTGALEEVAEQFSYDPSDEDPSFSMTGCRGVQDAIDNIYKEL